MGNLFPFGEGRRLGLGKSSKGTEGMTQRRTILLVDGGASSRVQTSTLIVLQPMRVTYGTPKHLN